MSVNLKIAKASLILMAASLFGHFLSLIKEIIVAKEFGITIGMDAYYAAITIPSLINNVLLSVFGAVFIPVFIRYKIKDKETADRIASILLNYFFLFFISGSVIIFFLSPWIIRYAFNGLNFETSLLSIKILRILSFTMIFSGLIGVMTGLLNAYEHFTWPAFSQIFITLSIIASIIFFVKQIGIFVLAWGLLAGLIIQFFFLIPICKNKGYHYYTDYDWKHPAVREMLKLGGIYFIAIVMAECNILVDKMMASYLVPGSMAALSYAGKLIQAPLLIFSSSISTAVFPFFTTQIAEGKINEMKDSLSKSIRMAGFIFIPLTVIMIVLSRPIIELLFQRGEFTSYATDLISIIFICYSFQFFFYTGGIIFGRVFLALKDMVSLLKITLFGVITNIILNLIFIKLINPPAAGIALSTSGVYLVVMFLLFISLKRKMVYLHGVYIIKGLLKIGLSSLIMGLTVLLSFTLCKNIIIFNTLSSKILRLLIPSMVGAFIFIFSSFILKLEELTKLKNIICNF